jgi:hypothetical protein
MVESGKKIKTKEAKIFVLKPTTYLSIRKFKVGYFVYE